MNKAIILDVDGVIIGNKKGINTPHPHPAVISKLKEVRKSGIPIVLCTAKPAFAIDWEIKNAELNNPHIADGGALLIDNKGIISKHYPINSNYASTIVKHMLKNNIYVEVYTSNDYFIDTKQKSDWTDKHTFVLQRNPQIVDNLENFAKNNIITKIMIIVADETQKPIGDEHFSPFAENVNMIWAVHPPILPLQFGFITAKGISKKQAVFDISTLLNIPPENILGVGDSTSDWQFIEECGYAATMGNAEPELKEKVQSKVNKGFIGGHVNDNGVIEIIDWFLTHHSSSLREDVAKTSTKQSSDFKDVDINETF